MGRAGRGWIRQVGVGMTGRGVGQVGMGRAGRDGYAR